MSKRKRKWLQKLWRMIIRGFCSMAAGEQMFVNPFYFSSVSSARMFYFRKCQEQEMLYFNQVIVEPDDVENIFE